ncbi:hypothetical protein DPX16_7551 [Anabarilius grahami]|uniref:Uncharacterized protein n=1 Tax=Anabarilius grahami TaxID=495550 RepID=A0A3N0YSK0_ANAGA|nr:hypothetical protein DPX16_7551 [Anabarilius grahami]
MPSGAEVMHAADCKGCWGGRAAHGSPAANLCYQLFPCLAQQRPTRARVHASDGSGNQVEQEYESGVRECTVEEEEEEEKKWRLNESVNTDLSLLEESPSGLWIQWKKE